MPEEVEKLGAKAQRLADGVGMLGQDVRSWTLLKVRYSADE